MKLRRHLSKQLTSSVPTKTTKRQQQQHFISLIHSSKSLRQLKQIHAQILRHRLLADSHVISQLISSASLHHPCNPSYPLAVFHSYPLPQNTFLFNSLIRALSDASRFASAFSHFVLMLRLNTRPNELTFPFVVKSASGISANLGRSLHCCVLEFGFECDNFIRLSLVGMYVKLDEVWSAMKLFDESPEIVKSSNVLLWNCLINGLCKAGEVEKGVELFNSMPERHVGSWNCVINGLLRSGKVEKARELFETMSERNVVSWTTMVAGLTQNGKHDEALSVFFRMVEEEGVRANDHTIVSALSACAKIGAFDAGVRVHKYVSSNGFRLNLAIGNALVDMYSKCGNIILARRVFGKIKEKDVQTWSVMLWGWVIHGSFKQAIQCFEKMTSAGINPDGVVFLAMITFCSHSGRVDEGINFFESMINDYAINPTIKHYTSMVDLFGRAGHLDEALSLIERLPIRPDITIWWALFNACMTHRNIDMAEQVSRRILQLKPKYHRNYVCLSNAYTGVDRSEDVEKVRHLMLSPDVENNRTWSFMELEGKVHTFVAGDHSHEEAKDVCLKLDKILQMQHEKEQELDALIVFRHCLREANAVADAIANLSSSSQTFFLVTDAATLPTHVRQIIAADKF